MYPNRILIQSVEIDERIFVCVCTARFRLHSSPFYIKFFWEFL